MHNYTSIKNNTQCHPRFVVGVLFALLLNLLSGVTLSAQDVPPPPVPPNLRGPNVAPPSPPNIQPGQNIPTPPQQVRPNVTQPNQNRRVAPVQNNNNRPQPTISTAAGNNASNNTVTSNGRDETVKAFTLVDEAGPQVLAWLEGITKKPILRAQNLPAVKISFNSQGPMSKEEAILAIESLLTLNGIAITEVGDKFLKAVPISDAANQVPVFLEGSARDRPPSQQLYTKLFRFDFLNAVNGEVQPIIQPVLSQTGKSSMVIFNKSNSVLVTDFLINLQRVEDIMEEADVPAQKKDEMRFYQLKFVKASELKGRLDSMINGTLQRYLQNNTFVEFDDRTNQLIVVTHDSNVGLIENMIESLDIDVEPSTSSKVFYIKHATATEVDQLLEEVIQGQQQQNNDRVAGQQNNQRGGNNNNNRPNNNNAPVQPNAAPTSTPVQTAQPSSGGGDGGGEALQFSEFITIVADERSNAIIVYGTRSDIKQIGKLIEEIDVLLAQVKIEVLIAEINLNESDGSGISRLNLAHGLGIPGLGDDIDKGLDVGGPGFSTAYNIRTGDFNLILNAINNDSDAQILSAPVIVTSHNQEASINVSESRPVITGSTTSTVNADTTSSTVQFRDIGIQLTVTPLIGSNGVIQLDIEQTVENLLGQIQIDGNDQPIIGKREANSFVSVNDGDVVILAGLQSRELSKSKSGVYMLSSIPLLGEIFKGRDNSDTRRELMIFIKPEVIYNQKDSTEQVDKTLERMNGGELIRDYLQTSDINVLVPEEEKKAPFFKFGSASKTRK